MSDRITEALRIKPKEKDARRIEITCIEIPGEEEQYKVCVTPKEKRDEPGHTNKGAYSYTNPYERLFEGRNATKRVLKYIEEIL